MTQRNSTDQATSTSKTLLYFTYLVRSNMKRWWHRPRRSFCRVFSCALSVSPSSLAAEAVSRASCDIPAQTHSPSCRTDRPSPRETLAACSRGTTGTCGTSTTTTTTTTTSQIISLHAATSNACEEIHDQQLERCKMYCLFKFMTVFLKMTLQK